VPLVVALTLLACTTTVNGNPVSGGSVVSDPGSGGVDSSFVKNSDGGEIDRLAATVITDVVTFWKGTYPATFNKDFEDLSGGYYSVDTSKKETNPPPCVRNSIDVEGNAFYCPSEDVIAWDRAALLPVLKERFGEAAVMLVLAHEMGHAVQRRAGLTTAEQRRNPGKYPTILIEAQADCYAGAFVRWVTDGNAEHLKVARDRLDAALESLITFRDPVGTEQSDKGAHGDAFDRVSAFQDGFDKGAKLCAEMSLDNRTFTLRGFLNAADAERGGNLPFDQLLRSITDDLNTYFGTVVTERGKQWAPPPLKPTDDNPKCTGGDQGPIAFCPNGSEIDIASKGELPDMHVEIGDYATGTILASRFGMAAMSVLGKPLEGEQAQRQVLCLAGSYTGTLLARQTGFALSPGDLDEAIQVLLRFDFASRDSAGKAIGTGFERVSVFRVGALQGAPACELS
jgi:predicted metalloprotease